MTERERGKMQALENLVHYLAGLIVRKELDTDGKLNVKTQLEHFISLAQYTADERKKSGVSDAFADAYEKSFSLLSEDIKLFGVEPLDPPGFEILRRFPKQ